MRQWLQSGPTRQSGEAVVAEWRGSGSRVARQW